MKSINAGYGQFTIKNTGYSPYYPVEITAKGFHNVAPDIPSAVAYLKSRFGHDVVYKVSRVI